MRGLESDKTGFETVEIEPTSAAHRIADAYPILADFLSKYANASQAD